MKYYRNKTYHEEIYSWDEIEKHPFSGDPIIVRVGNGSKWEFGNASGITNRKNLEEFTPDCYDCDCTIGCFEECGHEKLL